MTTGKVMNLDQLPDSVCARQPRDWRTQGPKGQLCDLLDICERLEEITVSKHFMCMSGGRGRL